MRACMCDTLARKPAQRVGFPAIPLKHHHCIKHYFNTMHHTHMQGAMVTPMVPAHAGPYLVRGGDGDGCTCMLLTYPTPIGTNAGLTLGN